MITVTRILQSDTPAALHPICKAMGFVRADLWRRYGALGAVGKMAGDIRKAVTAQKLYAELPVDGTIRNETIKDVINDVLTCKAAAKQKVRKVIAARTEDEAERRRLYTLLKKDEWLTDNFLHRQMRKRFRHGVSHCDNQFIVRSDRYTTKTVDGRLVIVIRVAHSHPIHLTTTSSGKNVALTGKNLRIIVKANHTEIHYSTDKGPGRPAGDRLLGVDKGYTEAFMDSDGQAHGRNFGRVIAEYSDVAAQTGKARNKLAALEKQHREAGRVAKADNILKNNRGRVKLEARIQRTRKKLKTIAFQAAHTIVDAAKVVVSEDLTAPISRKTRPWGPKQNRRMSAWAKGVLAEALDSVCTQRQAEHCLVNAAYTSQMDSVTGLLEGKRVGDKFYRINGDVLQADHNAAVNVLNRYTDTEITRFTPYQEVRRILLARSPAQLSVKGLQLGEQSRQRSADKSSVQLCTGL